jgi:glucose/arabinose dehydrogenase
MKTLALVSALVVLALPFQAPQVVRSLGFVSGLQSPVAFVQDPTDRSLFFAVEQGGRIRVVRNRAVGADFLDLRSAVTSGGERGLLGLALAPDFAVSGRFFVNFTDRNGDTVVARFRRSSPLVADPSSRFDLRWGPERAATIAQPFSNHNGGHLAFGPDGYLYIGLGDGGSGNDPQHLAQSPTSFLGKFLRIDVNVPDSHPAGYVVPADNPFASGGPVAARPEIWSFGWRNPWRYSFDDPALGGTGALVVADVGQGSWEEIDYEPPGRGRRNYGWRNREGAHPNVQTLPPAYLPLTDPIHEYGRTEGQSVTGGYVYRGRSMSAMRGRYFFADYVARRVWSVALTVNPSTGEAAAGDLRDHTADLGGAARVGNVSSFAVDAEGELYIVSHNLGSVLRLDAEPAAPTNLRIIREE